MTFERPEHVLIAEALAAMDGRWLLENRCFFGGGTAVVLLNGEYRRSLDVDFLCDDTEGYRALRTAAIGSGVRAFFGDPAEMVREFRADQYGIRAVLSWKGQPIKFEIVREVRIALDGTLSDILGVPVLTTSDQFAEKLLANADRGLDRSVAYRDAIDLGRLCLSNDGKIPEEAVIKAKSAYGEDVSRKLGLVLGRLSDDAEVRYAAESLLMPFAAVKTAVEALAEAADLAGSG